MGESKFSQAVTRIVRDVPIGKVVSYGQVAAYVGIPRGARQVGWTLRRLEGVEMPWWRVVNNAGRVTIKGNLFNDANKQRELLRGEGIEVGEDYNLDMEKHRFVASEELMKKWGLGSEYVRMVGDKFRIGYAMFS